MINAMYEWFPGGGRPWKEGDEGGGEIVGEGLTSSSSVLLAGRWAQGCLDFVLFLVL